MAVVKGFLTSVDVMAIKVSSTSFNNTHIYC